MSARGWAWSLSIGLAIDAVLAVTVLVIIRSAA
ncbi:hypothetical protein RKD45_002466 [Streptomyces griseus]